MPNNSVERTLILMKKAVLGGLLRDNYGTMGKPVDTRFAISLRDGNQIAGSP